MTLPCLLVLILCGRSGNITRSGAGMVCTANRPGDDKFDVRCYDEHFHKVIDRARELTRQGLADSVARRRLDQEIKDGRLRLPDHPTAGYRMLAWSWDDAEIAYQGPAGLD